MDREEASAALGFRVRFQLIRSATDSAYFGFSQQPPTTLLIDQHRFRSETTIDFDSSTNIGFAQKPSVELTYPTLTVPKCKVTGA